MVLPSPVYIHVAGYGLDFVKDTGFSGSRDSDGFGSRLCKIFLFSTTYRPTLGPTQPSNQWLPGALSPEVKRQGREADLSHLSNTEFKKGGAIPPFLHVS
jgi:hypothetical protein